MARGMSIRRASAIGFPLSSDSSRASSSKFSSMRSATRIRSRDRSSAGVLRHDANARDAAATAASTSSGPLSAISAMTCAGRGVDVRKESSRAGRPELAIDEIEDAFHAAGFYLRIAGIVVRSEPDGKRKAARSSLLRGLPPARPAARMPAAAERLPWPARPRRDALHHRPPGLRAVVQADPLGARRRARDLSRRFRPAKRRSGRRSCDSGASSRSSAS